MAWFDFIPGARQVYDAIPMGEYDSQTKALIQQLMGMSQGTTPSLAGQQTRDLFGRAQASQQSLAAGARPGQEGMAQRLAAQNTASLQAQGAQQGAMAQLAERQQATQQLAALLGQMQGVQSRGQRFLGGLKGGLETGALLLSDETKKKEIEKGDEDADAFLRALRPLTYEYRNKKDGKGRRLGVVVQDVEKSKMSRHTVVETPKGKAIDTRAMMGPVLAAIARLDAKKADR